MRAETLTDMILMLCIHFIHFTQRMHKLYTFWHVLIPYSSYILPANMQTWNSSEQSISRGQKLLTELCMLHHRMQTTIWKIPLRFPVHFLCNLKAAMFLPHNKEIFNKEIHMIVTMALQLVPVN